MNKAELISTIANKTEITKKKAGVIVDSIIDTIKETLATGAYVDIYGFGKLVVKDVDAKQCRNPKTGEPIDVPAKKVVKFKVAKAVKDAVNE